MLVVAFVPRLGVKIFALVSSLLYSAESYAAAGKLTKPAWGRSSASGWVSLRLRPLNLINLAFTVAAFVYLADVRPALASLTRR